jgi:hypothetical protein
MKNPAPILLLTPWLISTEKPAISLLNIVKKNQSINFSTTEFKRSAIAKEFKNHPKPLKDLLTSAVLKI